MGMSTAKAATSTEAGRVRLRFIKQRSGKYDAVELHRGDGCVERLENPKQGLAPHDMIHVLVEQTLGLRQGFIGMVLSGLPMAMTDQPRERENAGLYGTEAKQSESLVECVQAAVWDSTPVSAEYFREQLRITCAMREIPAPVLDDEAVTLLVDRVRLASQEWRELAAGEAMEFVLAA
jgi:hypothetical protein